MNTHMKFGAVIAVVGLIVGLILAFVIGPNHPGGNPFPIYLPIAMAAGFFVIGTVLAAVVEWSLK